MPVELFLPVQSLRRSPCSISCVSGENAIPCQSLCFCWMFPETRIFNDPQPSHSLLFRRSRTPKPVRSRPCPPPHSQLRIPNRLGNVQWSFKDKADSVIRVCCTTGPQHIMQNYADYLDLLFSQTAIRYTQTSSFSGSGWQIALRASPAGNDTSQHTEGRHRDDLLAAFSSTSLSAWAGPVSMPCHKHGKLLTHQEVKSPFNLYLCFCFWSPFGFGCCLSLQYAGFGLSLHS